MFSAVTVLLISDVFDVPQSLSHKTKSFDDYSERLALVLQKTSSIAILLNVLFIVICGPTLSWFH